MTMARDDGGNTSWLTRDPCPGRGETIVATSSKRIVLPCNLSYALSCKYPILFYGFTSLADFDSSTRAYIRLGPARGRRRFVDRSAETISETCKKFAAMWLADIPLCKRPPASTHLDRGDRYSDWPDSRRQSRLNVYGFKSVRFTQEHVLGQ